MSSTRWAQQPPPAQASLILTHSSVGEKGMTTLSAAPRVLGTSFSRYKVQGYQSTRFEPALALHPFEMRRAARTPRRIQKCVDASLQPNVVLRAWYHEVDPR